MELTRICTKCNVAKEIRHFHHKGLSVLGYRYRETRCSSCKRAERAARTAAQYEANKKKLEALRAAEFKPKSHRPQPEHEAAYV